MSLSSYPILEFEYPDEEESIVSESVPLFVGFSSVPIENLWRLIPEPEPRTTRTRPDSIAEWQRDIYPAEKLRLKAEVEAEASLGKLTGVINRVVAIQPNGENFYDSLLNTGSSSLLAGAQFANWLDGSFTGWSYEFEADAINPATIIAFDAERFVRMLGINAITNGGRAPLRMWFKNCDVLDPYLAAVEHEWRKHISLVTMLNRFGISPPSNYRSHADAFLDAQLIAELCSKLGLVATMNIGRVRSVFAAALSHDYQPPNETSQALAQAGSARGAALPI